MEEGDRESLIAIAKILESSDRPEDMVNVIKQIIKINPELDKDERDLLAVAYKNQITPKRTCFLSLKEVIKDETESKDLGFNRISILNEVQAKTYDEIHNICNDLINLVSQELIPASQCPHSRIFYHKSIADYYRYMCETQENNDKAHSIEQAQKYYENAIEISRENVPIFKPSSLELHLNYAVFLKTVENNTEKAFHYLNDIYQECLPLLEENSEDSFYEVSSIVMLIKENLAQWNQKCF